MAIIPSSCAFFALMLTSSLAVAGPKIVTSILPINSITAQVMGGLGSPTLVYSGKSSEHSAQLTPAQIAEMGQADLVFMIGGGLELKMGQLSGSEAVGGKKFISLISSPGIKRLALRAGGVYETHNHAHEGEKETKTDHEEGQTDHHDDMHNNQASHEINISVTSPAQSSALPPSQDNPHIWLDPENASAITEAIAAKLSAVDPPNAAHYKANATAYKATLALLTAEIKTATAPVEQQAFMVFHDAFPYYEARFHLLNRGSISDANASAPPLARITELRKKISEAGVVCLFSEPQYNPKFITLITEGLSVKTGVLDAMGYDIPPGPDAYLLMMRKLTQNLVSCLKS